MKTNPKFYAILLLIGSIVVPLIMMNYFKQDIERTNLSFLTVGFCLFVALMSYFVLTNPEVSPVFIVEIPTHFTKEDLHKIGNTTKRLMFEYHCIIVQRNDIDDIQFKYFGMNEVKRKGLKAIEREILEEFAGTGMDDDFMSKIIKEWWEKQNHIERVNLVSKHYTAIGQKTVWDLTDSDVVKLYEFEAIKEA